MTGVSEELIKKMIAKAYKARENAYAPYSHFKVGAALYCAKEDNNGYDIITGCNIENASYPAGNCAERTAVFKAVSDGYNIFKAIAIVGGYDEKTENGDYISPCGICRQVLRELVNPNDFYVIMAKNEEDYVVKTLKDLLPMSFGPDNLSR